MIEAYLAVLELGYFELTEAFRELRNENVWKRPTDNLLSIGEMAAHVSYWEAVRFAGEADGEGNDLPDPAKCRVRSLLIDRRFAYYPMNIANPPSEEQRALTAQQVCDEVVRIHNEAAAILRERNPDLKTPPSDKSTSPDYDQILKYAAFHVGYHTGQIFSARYLLGENPPDN